jgi:acylpyruvate hydrolase
LGVVIGKTGKNISQGDAYGHVKGFFISLDITARDLQNKAKKAGKPWTVAKGFDTFCPIGSELMKCEDLMQDGKLKNLTIFIKVNGQVKQCGKTNDMIFNVPQAIEAISQVMTLEEDDLILTGTPEGVSQIKAGDVVEFGVEGFKSYEFNVV